MAEEKYPWAIAPYKDFTTKGFALAVMEESVVCILFSAIVAITNNPIVFYLRLGGFIGCALNFVIHIGSPF